MRRTHPAWRLLAADHAPLIASFLHHSLIQPNTCTQSRQDLIALLEDHLFHLREQLGEDAFPKAAAHYLDDRALDERALLRKYYVVNTDQPPIRVDPGR